MKAGMQNKKPQAAASAGEPSVMAPSLGPAFLQSDKFYWILLGLVIVAVSVIRLRFIGMPLERDEGEYAYFGQQILQGIAPYLETYNLKLPGVYYMYAFIMLIFGQSAEGIHTGLLVMNAGTMVVLFFAIKRFFNGMTGVLTAAFYGVMALGLGVFGFAAHATQFVVFFLALALLFLAIYAEKKTLLHAALTGAMLGMAFLMKQQAVYFILMGGIVLVGFQLLEKARDLKKTLVHASLFTVGIFVPYMLVVLLMLVSGSFGKFWFWTVEYAGKYAAGQSWGLGKVSLGDNGGAIWSEQWPIWGCAVAGIALLWATKFSSKQRLLATALLILGALATTPSFYFRQHYFVVALPAVALLAALAVDVAGRSLAKFTKLASLGIALPLFVLVAATFIIVSAGKFQYYYAAKDPVKLCKAIYGANPFVESLAIADYIHKNSSETDQVAVLGSEPQIPFYAHQKSATGHIYLYGLMEDQAYNLKMQEEMITEIERNKPKYFVYVNIGTSTGRTPQSPTRIFDWAERYIGMFYNQVGIVEVAGGKGESKFYWDAEAMRHMPVGQEVIWVFRRKA